MKKNIILMDLSLLLFAITGFFYFLIGNGYYLLILSILPICLYIFSAVIKMDKDNYVWFVFILFLWISALISKYTESCYKFMFIVLILFAAKLIFESVYGWHKKLSKIFYIMAFIHTAAVLLCLVIPDTISGIVDKLYTGDTLDTYEMLFENEAYAGICGQTGFAAFFISVFLGYGVCGILCENKRKWNTVAIILGVIGLFLTTKRGILLANVVSIIIFFVIHNKNNRKVLKNFAIYLGLFLLGFFILSKIPEVRNVFLKTKILSDTGDISNGRIELWKATIELWKDSPIFGLGINTLHHYYGISSHNSYVQLLAEIGVFGLASYIAVVIASFVKSCKIYSEVKKDTDLSNKEKVTFGVSLYMQVIFIVYCMFGNPIYGISFLLIYMFFIACIKSYAQKKS